ncbi:hypothetical protein ACQX2H_12080, partial [Corynebacterium diphtheriae]
YTAPDDRLPAVKLLEVLALAKRSLPLPSGSTGGVFQAPTQAQFQALGGLHFFEDKQRAGIGLGLRYEGFLAQGGKFATADLGTDDAVERPIGWCRASMRAS